MIDADLIFSINLYGIYILLIIASIVGIGSFIQVSRLAIVWFRKRFGLYRKDKRSDSAR